MWFKVDGRVVLIEWADEWAKCWKVKGADWGGGGGGPVSSRRAQSMDKRSTDVLGFVEIGAQVI